MSNRRSIVSTWRSFKPMPRSSTSSARRRSISPVAILPPAVVIWPRRLSRPPSSACAAVTCGLALPPVRALIRLARATRPSVSLPALRSARPLAMLDIKPPAACAICAATSGLSLIMPPKRPSKPGCCASGVVGISGCSTAPSGKPPMPAVRSPLMPSACIIDGRIVAAFCCFCCDCIVLSPDGIWPVRTASCISCCVPPVPRRYCSFSAPVSSPSMSATLGSTGSLLQGLGVNVVIGVPA